jgi:hypothetical protein
MRVSILSSQALISVSTYRSVGVTRIGRERNCCQALYRSPIGMDLRWWRNSAGDEIGSGNETALSAGGGVSLEVSAGVPFGTGGVSRVSIQAVRLTSGRGNGNEQAERDSQSESAFPRHIRGHRIHIYCHYCIKYLDMKALSHIVNILFRIMDLY